MGVKSASEEKSQNEELEKQRQEKTWETDRDRRGQCVGRGLGRVEQRAV